MTTAIDKTTANDEVQRIRKHLNISIGRLIELDLDAESSDWLAALELCYEELTGEVAVDD